MVTVRSDMTLKSMPLGVQRWMSGRMSRTPSTVSMTLASGCLVTCTRTAGLPANQPAARVLRTPRETVAISPTRVTPPLRERTMTFS